MVSTQVLQSSWGRRPCNYDDPWMVTFTPLRLIINDWYELIHVQNWQTWSCPFGRVWTEVQRKRLPMCQPYCTIDSWSRMSYHDRLVLTDKLSVLNKKGVAYNSTPYETPMQPYLLVHICLCQVAYKPMVVRWLSLILSPVAPAHIGNWPAAAATTMIFSMDRHQSMWFEVTQIGWIPLLLLPWGILCIDLLWRYHPSLPVHGHMYRRYLYCVLYLSYF